MAARPARDEKHSDDLVAYRLSDQVGHLLRRAHQRASSIFAAEITATTRLTPLQFAALVRVSERGPVSQNALGRQTAMDAATVHGVVGRLKDRELVDSVPDPDDRRRNLISVSAQGKRLLADAIPLGADVTEKTLEPLSSAERRQFLKLLARLSEAEPEV